METTMEEKDEYPYIQKGRVDPGDGFLLDEQAWFVAATGGLAILATNFEGRTRSFTAEQLKEARRIGKKWIGLMQWVAAMKGAMIGYQLAPKGMPAPLREWLIGELEELGTLVDGTVEELEEQAAGAEE
jgi:hypothetical protein